MARGRSQTNRAGASGPSGGAGSLCPAQAVVQDEHRWLQHADSFFCPIFRCNQGVDLTSSYDLIRSQLIKGMGLSKTPPDRKPSCDLLERAGSCT